MSVTDFERRKVAASLRGRREGSVPVFIAKAAYGVDYATGRDVQKLPSRLADLIDRPTCRLRPEEPFSPWGVCTECGAFVNNVSAVSDGAKYTSVRYCQNCDAEVVS